MLSTFIILGTSWAIGAKSDAHLVRTRVCILALGYWIPASEYIEDQRWVVELTSNPVRSIRQARDASNLSAWYVCLSSWAASLAPARSG
jgi:hypothetical protein